MPLRDATLALDEDFPDLRGRKYKNQQTFLKRWAMPTIVFALLVTNLISLIYTRNTDQSTGQSDASDPDHGAAIQDSIVLDRTWKQFWWNTKYSSRNHNESNALWEAVRPSHGFIAMDEGWASRRNWPESMKLPSNDSKRVYLLEAYHQIHCLVSVPMGHGLFDFFARLADRGELEDFAKDILGSRRE
ncbi:MAG: hypothetical protein L6R39_002104 [Caloplaca ligustica]|nr:MAG: hypothetical protein L6R39_002104 [Caloplaca ligustica]